MQGRFGSTKTFAAGLIRYHTTHWHVAFERSITQTVEVRVAAVECIAALAPPAAVARHVARALADADESVRCAALLALHRSTDADVRLAFRGGWDSSQYSCCAFFDSVLQSGGICHRSLSC